MGRVQRFLINRYGSQAGTSIESVRYLFKVTEHLSLSCHTANKITTFQLETQIKEFFLQTKSLTT